MSTFTLQDLTLPMTAEDAIKAIEQHTPPQPTTKEQWMEYGMNNPLSTSAIAYATQHAPEPQPTLCESTQTDLPSIINNICAQLQLLATVISQQPNTTPPEGANLQDCVEQVLQQAVWFDELVHGKLNEMDFDDALENCVDRYCENYFSYNFDPRDHFDIDEAVADRVDDKLEDIVAEKIDQAVEEYMSGATITIERN